MLATLDKALVSTWDPLKPVDIEESSFECKGSGRG